LELELELELELGDRVLVRRDWVDPVGLI
jgi:hypothetical protein